MSLTILIAFFLEPLQIGAKQVLISNKLSANCQYKDKINVKEPSLSLFFYLCSQLLHQYKNEKKCHHWINYNRDFCRDFI